ncbi:MAG: nuclear transport factor 2 family protein [Pseudonocardiaceae bacterium]
MSIGSLAVAEEWLGAVNRGASRRVAQLSAEDVEIIGPRGTVRGRQVLSEWMTRAGFSADALRWFCGGDGSVVVEQDARWVDPATGTEQDRARVASQFLIDGACVAHYARHDKLAHALAAAGLDARDEVIALEWHQPQRPRPHRADQAGHASQG